MVQIIKLKIILITFFYIFSVGIAFSQINGKTYELWPAEILEAANTAKNIPNLSNEEKIIIQICNLARTNGKLFSETFLKDYLEDKKTNNYSRSLIKNLKTISELPLLKYQDDLYEVAREHATTSGKRGTLGHQRFDKRYGPLLGKYSSVAENCAYGYETGIKNALELLIDEGVPDLGHRKNILNPEFNSIGVSIKPHKTYRYNCVMSFGSKIK
jgi:uncharacterized protein YkwD